MPAALASGLHHTGFQLLHVYPHAHWARSAGVQISPVLTITAPIKQLLLKQAIWWN
jgi:hypothetical protein